MVCLQTKANLQLSTALVWVPFKFSFFFISGKSYTEDPPRWPDDVISNTLPAHLAQPSITPNQAHLPTHPVWSHDRDMASFNDVATPPTLAPPLPYDVTSSMLAHQRWVAMTTYAVMQNRAAMEAWNLSVSAKGKGMAHTLQNDRFIHEEKHNILRSADRATTSEQTEPEDLTLSSLGKYKL